MRRWIQGVGISALRFSELAKKAAKFLIDTGEIPKFRYVTKASLKGGASASEVTTGEVPAEDSW